MHISTQCFVSIASIAFTWKLNVIGLFVCIKYTKPYHLSIASTQRAGYKSLASYSYVHLLLHCLKICLRCVSNGSNVLFTTMAPGHYIQHDTIPLFYCSTMPLRYHSTMYVSKTFPVKCSVTMATCYYANVRLFVAMSLRHNMTLCHNVRVNLCNYVTVL